MTDIEIISSATCPFAQRTRMALIEKGLDFRLTEISLDAKPDWFLAISPYGKVPVLRHGDVTLFESAVINEYLEDIQPEPALLPRDPAARAKARIWIDFANVRFIPHVYKYMLAQDAAGQDMHRRRLLEAFDHMETEGLGRSGGPYWLGRDLSLIDLSFFPRHRTVLGDRALSRLHHSRVVPAADRLAGPDAAAALRRRDQRQSRDLYPRLAQVCREHQHRNHGPRHA